MKPKHLTLVILNLMAVFVLLLLLGTPFYFASTISKPASIAGTKTQTPYVIVSQVDKFPNATLVQSGSSYEISFDKISQSQALTSLLLITNPTNKTQRYEIVRAGGISEVFFGEDLQNRQTSIQAPSSVTIPISIYSGSESTSSSQTVKFQIEAK